MFDDSWTHCAQNLTAFRVYYGFDFSLTDMVASDITVGYCTNWGIKLGGAVQLNRAHVSGCGNNENVPTYPERQAAAWFSGDNNQVNNLYVENCYVGAYIDGDNNRLSDLYSHSCIEKNIHIVGSENQINQFFLKVSDIGIEVADQNNQISNGVIWPSAADTIGVKITNGTGQRLTHVRFGQYAQSTAMGVVAATTLNNCDIDVFVEYGDVGIDLVSGGTDSDSDSDGIVHVASGTSYIGSNNRIHIQTKAGSAPTQIIDLPSGWSTTPTSTTNEIVVNGVRWYPPAP